ncbi:hypothetical protein RJ639_013110 [Escallonia herrerae]|uniref:UspA domain-containing protein n=1 Tax=Escallonia herrerae TaxID=1293975 RepID=A0AA88VG27_9ASTE|nr:hypothetical protein RJ639_013110 [Escallonia herrerae]
MSATPAKIVIGISLDAEDSAELLSWAIRNVAHPNDTIVALHVLVTEGMTKPGARRKEETKEWKSIARYQTQIRKAKAFVISVMADFAKTCQSNQVKLEARVGFSSGVGRGLIEEARGISAQFLLISSSRNRSNR